MKLIKSYLTKIKSIASAAKKDQKKLSGYNKNYNDYVKKYKDLRGKKNEDINDFKFDRKAYNNIFKEFTELLKSNNYEIENKNIVLTIGEYSENKRGLFENSGFSNPYLNKKNIEIFENNYIHWTVLPDSINFDVSQEIIFTDSETSLENSGLKCILNSIKNIKENSKISSIILRIKPDLFINNLGEDGKKEKTKYVFNSYYKALNFINKNFEFKIPIYVLLTDAEEIFGFDSFLKIVSEEEKCQIFGISNHRDIDEPYSEELGRSLVYDFRNLLKSFLARKILEDLEQEDFKNILLFVNNCFYIVDQINIFIDFLFLNKSIDSSALFRGFYLCGSEVKNSSATPLGMEKYKSLIDKNLNLSPEIKINNESQKIFFFKELYNKKISRDFSFNLPSNHLINSNKNHQYASLSLLSIVILSLPLVSYNFYKNLNESSNNIQLILNNLSEHVTNKVNEKKSNIDSSKVNLTEMLNIFKAIDTKRNNHLSSSYSPFSLLSGFDNRVMEFLERMVITFEARPVRNLLQDKLKFMTIIDATGNNKSSPEESYNNILEYIKALTFLENSSKEYNSFAVEMKVDNLNIILQKLLDLDLSDIFPKTNIVINNPAKKYGYKEINFIDFKLDYTNKFEILFNRMISSIENEYIIRENSDKLISYIDNPKLNIINNDYYKYLNTILSFLDTISNKIDFYSSSSQIVTAAGTEIKLDKLNYIVKNGAFLDNNTIANMDIKIKEAINKRNQNILEYNSISLGPLYTLGEDKVSLKLSKNILSLKHLIYDLNQTNFIKPFKEEYSIFDKEFSSNTFDWNKTNIDYLVNNIDVYNKYINDKINQFPESIKPYVQESVLLGLNQILIKNLDTKSEIASKTSQSDTDKEVIIFNRKKEDIIKILKFFRENDRYNVSKELKLETIEKINYYLKYFKNKVSKNVHYEPARRDFDWWDGILPPAFEAYQVYEGRELSDYVSLQNQEISRVLTEYIQPLLEISSEATNGLLLKNSSEYLFWKQINEEYLNKEKDSSVRSLNDFILTTLTTTTADNCMSIVDTKQKGYAKNDFFTLKQREINSQFSQRCKKIFQNKIAYDFNKLVKNFNENLAGKFPFVDDFNMDKSEDVDEGTLKDFFAQFDTFLKDEATFNYISNSKIERWKNAKDFIIKMRNVSDFMKGIHIDEKNPNNSAFDLLVDFNQLKDSELNTFGLLERKVETSNKSISNLSLDKSISWSPSEEISFSFRWAKDYDQTPSLAENIQGEKYLNDLNETTKTVSFTARDKWALLYLLRKHALNKSDWYYSQNLVFKIPIKNLNSKNNSEKSIVNSMAKVILKVKFVDKNKKSAFPLPVFPAQIDSILISNL